MDPASIITMFRFNTWANDGVREGLLAADEQVLRAPLEGMWFGSIFSILTHIHSAEAIWLARLRDGEPWPRPLAPEDFASAEGLAEAWHAMDEAWEAWVQTLSAERLSAEVKGQRRDGSSWAYPLWQPLMQVAFHGTEHRGHATVAMTQLGIQHGPQDFLEQFRSEA
jgi:uncharacterized damage-inducible protein DinB